MEAHFPYIRRSIQLAAQAREKGNHPFGALLLWRDKIVLSAENRVTEENDVTSHAELNLVSLASRQFSREEREQMTLYTSTEPCCMCAGAIFWAGIKEVVYSFPAVELENLSGESLLLPCREVFTRGKPKISVIGPLLPEEGRKVHLNFWP